MRNIAIRPVGLKDTEDLANLYSELNSCNANPDTVDAAIQDTQATLQGDLKQLTLIAHDSDTGEALGSGSLIWQNEIQMYEPVLDGLELTKTSGDIMEFGSMIVAPEARGQGIGRSISEVRARFAHIFSPDLLLAEFLPEYLNTQKKNTFFWQEDILPSLYASGSMPALMQACSQMTGKAIASPGALLKALETELSSKDRNQLVSEFFPKYLPESALDYCGTIGKMTKPALHNLQGIYQDRFELAGYFPTDGGKNYTASGNLEAKLSIPFTNEGLSFMTTLPDTQDQIDFELSA